MRAGEFTDGEYVLRAKIDMASPNMNMRDPTLYRIRHQAHYRRGDEWCIYPMYDFTECLCDEIEGVTHSLCDIGYENHRPLYDWILRQVGSEDPPHQYEFARLNITYTVLSKRHLLRLVSEGHVSGWDDPRMPTISGLRRRGYTPEAIKAFIREVGVAKRENLVEIGLLEYHIREDLNKHARRVLGVLDPVKLIIDNYPEGQVEELEGINNPEDESAGTRMLPFTRELYIERDDFREEAPKKYHRLAPGKEVRLRYGYYVTCVDYEKDPESGEISEIHCTYDPETRGGSAPDGRKVRGTIHWVSAPTAVDAEVRLYDRLFTVEAPDPSAADLVELLNPDSRRVLTGCKVEPSLAGAESGSRYQFERQGYFCVDDDSTVGGLVFNRTVALRDSWSKIEKSQGKQT
jgi:glutaminyl-tRNA synthetase